jgi:hypothetical protein
MQEVTGDNQRSDLMMRQTANSSHQPAGGFQIPRISQVPSLNNNFGSSGQQENNSMTGSNQAFSNPMIQGAMMNNQQSRPQMVGLPPINSVPGIN